MALFTCPICSGVVSTKALSCPHCGLAGDNLHEPKSGDAVDPVNLSSEAVIRGDKICLPYKNKTIISTLLGMVGTIATSFTIWAFVSGLYALGCILAIFGGAMIAIGYEVYHSFVMLTQRGILIRRPELDVSTGFSFKTFLRWDQIKEMHISNSHPEGNVKLVLENGDAINLPRVSNNSILLAQAIQTRAQSAGAVMNITNGKVSEEIILGPIELPPTNTPFVRAMALVISIVLVILYWIFMPTKAPDNSELELNKYPERQKTEPADLNERLRLKFPELFDVDRKKSVLPPPR